MRSSNHDSQDKKGVWVDFPGFNHAVFIEDISSDDEMKVYENPAFQPNHAPNVQLQHQQVSQTVQTESTRPQATTNINHTASYPINVTQLPATQANQNSLTSNSTVVDTLSQVSRSTSRTNEPASSVSSQLSRSSATKQNVPKVGPKKGDKIVTRRSFQSSDAPSVEISTKLVMKVQEVKSGNLLVDSPSWSSMHWIGKDKIKYLRRYRPTQAGQIARRTAPRRAAPRTQVEEFILNRDAVMRSGPDFTAPVITNLLAESTVLVNMKTYSKIENIIHKGQNKKRILVKAKDEYDDVKMGWITMSTEKGPMCRRKVRQQPRNTPARRNRFRN